MCGIFGVVSKNGDATTLARAGIICLDHRGGEQTGVMGYGPADGCIRGRVVAGDANKLAVKYRGERGQTVAIAHARYGTVGKAKSCNGQPMIEVVHDEQVAIAHNGEIAWVDFMGRKMKVDDLRKWLGRQGVTFRATSDTEIIFPLLARSEKPTLLEKVIEVCNMLHGSFALLVMSKGQLIAVTDPLRNRSITMGRHNGSIAFASESVALDLLEMTVDHEFAPGEVVCVDEQLNVSTHQLSRQTPKAQCVLEGIYFARPDSIIFGRSVSRFRKNLGAQAAEEYVQYCDEHGIDLNGIIVCPVLDSGMSSALGVYRHLRNRGFSVEWDFGLFRMHGKRSFTLPEQGLREALNDLKHNPDRDVVAGSRILLIDDSRIRGTVIGKLVPKLKRAGAKEIHLLFPSPLVRGECFLGINIKNLKTLVANRESVCESREALEVNSLFHLSLDGLRKVLGNTEDFCLGCFTGQYPVDNPLTVS